MGGGEMKEYKWACIGCGHIAYKPAQAFGEKGRLLNPSAFVL